jgi:hypothetical protein
VASGVSSFVIVTTRDLPEAYFLAMFLESGAQRLAMVNVVARPVADQLRVLARLRRNRGSAYVADLLLARAEHWFPGAGAAATRSGGVPGGGRGVRAPRSIGPSPSRLHRSSRGARPGLRPESRAGLSAARRCADHPTGAVSARAAGRAQSTLGLLPEFRGSDCPIWAFALQRPDCSGYTIHRVVEKVDAGDVLRRQPVAVRDEPTLGDYLRRLQREASEGFVGVIDQILQGARLPPCPRTAAAATFPLPAGRHAGRPSRSTTS